MIVPVEINKKSLSDQIYDALIMRITNLSYLPGEKINLDSLKAEFHVSTAPIREALQRLVKDNLIIIKPRVGFYVVDLTEKEVKELYDARKALETYSLRLSVQRMNEKDILDMEEQFMELEKAITVHRTIEEIPLNTCQMLDMRLHNDIIIKASENKYIIDFYASLNNFSSIIRHFVFRVDEDTREHLAIIDAMKKHDISRAEELLVTHLVNAERATLSWLSQSMKECGTQNGENR